MTSVVNETAPLSDRSTAISVPQASVRGSDANNVCLTIQRVKRWHGKKTKGKENLNLWVTVGGWPIQWLCCNRQDSETKTVCRGSSELTVTKKS
jgi:hypothetical protein